VFTYHWQLTDETILSKHSPSVPLITNVNSIALLFVCRQTLSTRLLPISLWTQFTEQLYPVTLILRCQAEDKRKKHSSLLIQVLLFRQNVNTLVLLQTERRLHTLKQQVAILKW